MMLYLTGASNSISKGLVEQTDPSKSLGGYLSSSAVPNGALNSLFDLVSSYTLQKKQKETIAIGLVNKLKRSVKNVELKIVSNSENVASFKVSAVEVDPSNYYMESISGRYQEPMSSQFFDATFHRASVDFKITQMAQKGDEIAFFPFDVQVEVKESGLEGTWSAIEDAFDNDSTYEAIRITENVIRVLRRDEEVIDEPIRVNTVSTGFLKLEPMGDFKNGKDNTVILKENGFKPNEAIGIWLQRSINKSGYVDDETLVDRYKSKYMLNDVENIELVITYELEDEYDKQDYSKEYA